MVDFLGWIINTGRFEKSRWWRTADREEVQGSLSAWYLFDRKLRPTRTTPMSVHLWYRYANYRYAGGYAPAGYYGGTRRMAWDAHQASLWRGVRLAAIYRRSESYAEQLVMWKVLANVEAYYRSGAQADPALTIAMIIGGYPPYPPTLKQACRMDDLSGFVASTVRLYFGPPPTDYKKRCHDLYLQERY